MYKRLMTVIISTMLMLSIFTNTAMASDLPSGRPGMEVAMDLYDNGLICIGTSYAEMQIMEHIYNSGTIEIDPDTYQNAMQNALNSAKRYEQKANALFMSIIEMNAALEEPYDMEIFAAQRSEFFQNVINFWGGFYDAATKAMLVNDFSVFEQFDNTLTGVHAECSDWEQSFEIE